MTSIRFLVFALALVASVSSRAEVLASLGTSVMFEAATSGRSYDQRQPISIRGGYRFPRFDAYAEYSRFEVATGTSFVGVSRRRDQALAWARVMKSEWRIAPFAAVGAGLLTERVETRFGNENRSDGGSPQLVTAIAVGGMTPLSKWLELSLEARGENSSAYSPHQLFGLSLFLSAKF